MSDVLHRICERKRLEIADREAVHPLPKITAAAAAADATRGFEQALRAQLGAGGPAVVAEIKRASPSRGLIRADFNPRELALAYEHGGAACLSVLTDMAHFQGHDDHLKVARAACALPVLRKDFILSRYQVYETRAIGADCLLLIVATLSDDELAELEDLATELGLDVLVEVHDAAELDRALRLRSRLIGINNRNLRTLEVDLATTEALAPRVPDDRLIVCESGLYTHADIERMAAVGARCFLVGESLMRQEDVTAALRTLLGHDSPRAAAN